VTAETTSEKRRTALEVIGKVSDRPPGELAPEHDLVADLGIESPEALRMLVELEEKLGVEISDEEAAAMNTVGDILAYVDRLE
jgi:acyl carrier protein